MCKKTTSANVGACSGLAPSASYTCATGANCNQITSCWNPATSQVLAGAMATICNGGTATACQVISYN